ncbi:MAG: rhodanese-like domain-containing protein [Bacteroidota bacterium]|nr:rhodanese-like domain-containing protein [Bacteroidota bacterium]
MKTLKSLFLFVITTTLLSSCSTEPIKVYADVESLINEAQEKAVFIKADELKTIIDNKHNFIIVDCREPDIYVEGHIPGSVNIPRGILEFSGKISNRREPVYIYCNDYKKAVLAAESLIKLKYQVVKVVDGGWEKWHETYPELIEEGAGGSAEEEIAKPSDGGGCGG